MRISKEVELRYFTAWSGAVDTMDTLKTLNNEVTDDIFTYLENIMIDALGDENGVVSETTVNDFLWFERDTIAEWLGYKDWEALERAAEGEEDEEEEDEEGEDE